MGGSVVSSVAVGRRTCDRDGSVVSSVVVGRHTCDRDGSVVGSVGVGRRTCDREIASLTPGQLSLPSLQGR